MEITSRENKIFKDLLKLTQKKYRRETGLCIVEGEKLVNEHADSAVQIFVRAGKSVTSLRGAGATRQSHLGFELWKKNVFTLTDKLWNEVSGLENSSGVLAIVKIPQKRQIVYSPFSSNANSEDTNCVSTYLVLDGIQDPGNVGTILRTAAAFGFNTVFCINSADVWSQKVIRAASGVQFGLDIREQSVFNKPNDSLLLAADMMGDNPVEIAKSLRTSKQQFGLVLGNEGKGISDEMKKHVDKFVTIPMSKDVESLNVAVAGGILMWELKK